MLSRWLGWSGAAVVDLLWPERCLLCGVVAGGAPWADAGRRVSGLRRWDRPHLCLRCREGLDGESRARVVPLTETESLLVAAGREETAELVALVGALKYHGVRGVAWALADVAAAAVARLPAARASETALVPVPLHAGRRRERGFNQAELLARLLAARFDWPVAARVVRRRRSTPQQAKIASDARRRRANVDGAFAAAQAEPRAPALVLVDDLATSGETLASVARALRRGGWEVRGALVAGAGAQCGRAPGDES